MGMSDLKVLPDRMVSHLRRRQILIMNTVNIKSQWFHFGISTCNSPAEVSDGKIFVSIPGINQGWKNLTLNVWLQCA